MPAMTFAEGILALVRDGRHMHMRAAAILIAVATAPKPGIRPYVIAASLNVSRPDVTRTVDELVKRGLVVRHADETIHAIVLKPTQAGLELARWMCTPS